MRFRIWMIAVSLLVATALGVAVVLGVKNHEDHVLTAQITQTEAELRLMGARIANIKDHEFKTIAEYVAAYAAIEPLLTEYDQKLREYSELYNPAQQRDQKRRLINIHRLHNRHNPEVWRNTSEIIALIREINDVMRKQASVIRDMHSLPAQEQVQFWHEEFMPLVAQEHALRERLLVAGPKNFSERAAAWRQSRSSPPPQNPPPRKGVPPVHAAHTSPPNPPPPHSF